MITRLTRDDLDACVEVYVDTFGAAPWNETWRVEDAAQRLGDFLATPRSHGVCAWDGERLVGFALGHRQRAGTVDHFLLQEMCVRTDRQRAGHGGRLLDALAADAADVEHWYLLTARESPAAAFYARHGFRAARRMGVFVRP